MLADSSSTNALQHPPGGPLGVDPDLQGARRAATLILLRDGDAGPEVLLMRRAERSGDSRSGVWVFPGGALDPADAGMQALCEAADEAAWNQRLGLPSGGLDYAVAALRESFEEVGLLLAHGTAEAMSSVQMQRSQLQTGAAFAEACRGAGLRLATDQLRYFSHWLTPPGMKQRFDTRFFIARMPEGQTAVADAAEALEVAWLRPADALAAGLKLLPVTERTLQQLSRHASVQAALEATDAQAAVRRTMPRLGRDEKGTRPFLPDHWAWAEIGRLDPTGRGDVFADLLPLRAVALSERVTRVTCNNGSVMTGPGTNTYLLRAPGGDEVAVLDPGPDDADTEAHLQAVLAAAKPGRITRILVTHTHTDHSPAARRLQALTGATLVGRVASHPMWQDATFVPDHVPADGERLSLGEGCTLRAVPTPGHASNHVCWLLEEERLLFTGDHVMQGSTVVINPPDGDMAAYCAALESLLALDLDWFAPGHGFLIAEPQAEVRRLLAHRQAREDKVLAALRAQAAPVTVQALVPEVYGDVPASRHGIAARSLSANLLKLAAQGQAKMDDEARWEAA
ncbi:MBL fold metallo-hydrolase [Ideonella azotifigens]|uniref:Nudix hydrolase domain-containing protein n=2 Tax=Ideonella azotifigens TaxID=513160 RepID=A0ABP3VTG2_9BURK|nr:MBL fold metallo-hydrolase [Ideonella azotifigens]MCD2339357.1 MBL fold metallo-hydrolase [Ideonella azotifigens]